MNKQRPSVLAILTMVAFTASCVGLLVFLWLSFGGSLPLQPQGYRFDVEFDQAVALAAQSQVKISGVNVGHVVSVGLDRRTGLNRAVIQIDKQFAPRPTDTRAILRQKTLLGETFVQLSAGSPSAPKLQDGGTLPHAEVAPTVALDQILSTFDPTTRKAFQTWMQQGAVALTNRGQQFNTALADLYPFATNVESVLAVLRRQGQATSTLLRDGGQVFSALSRSPSALQGFVRNSNAVFAATASRDTALADTIRAFPAFLAQTRSSSERLGRFSADTQPLVDELHPAAVQLTPALRKLVVAAPELRTLVTVVGPLNQAARTGFPALQRFLVDSLPFLQRLKPYLGQLVPVIDYIDLYRRDVAGFFANSTATSQGTLAGAYGHALHYLRVSNPINPEVLAPYQDRPSSNRSNPYLAPGGYTLRRGLKVFGSYLCTRHGLPGLDPSLSNSTTTVAGTVLTIAQLLQKYYFTSDPSGPRCVAQSPLARLTTGGSQTFPQLKPLP